MATLCIVTNCWPLRIKHMGTLLIHLNHHLVNPVATFLGLSSVIHNDINSNKLCFILSVSHVCQIWMKSFFAESCASYFFEPICTSVKGGGAYFSNKTRPMYQGCIIEMRCTGILANNGIFKKARILIYLQNKTFT